MTTQEIAKELFEAIYGSSLRKYGSGNWWPPSVEERFEKTIERLFVQADSPKPAKRHVIVDRRNDVWEQQSNGKYCLVASKNGYLSKANGVELGYIIDNFGPVTDLEPVKEPEPPEVKKRHAVIDCDGDRWEQQDDGNYMHLELRIKNPIETVAKEYGPLKESPDCMKSIPQETLQVGDVVGLKSGGPSMTVIKVEGDRVLCQWFFGKELKSNSFPIPALRKETT